MHQRLEGYRAQNGGQESFPEMRRQGEYISFILFEYHKENLRPKVLLLQLFATRQNGQFLSLDIVWSQHMLMRFRSS